MKYIVDMWKIHHGFVEVEASCKEEAEHKATQLYLQNQTQWTDYGLDFSAKPKIESIRR